MRFGETFPRQALRGVGLAVALSLSAIACSDQTDATKVDQVDYSELSMAYVAPGSAALVPKVPDDERSAFEDIPEIRPSTDSAGKGDAAPARVALRLDTPVRLPAAFSASASEGSGDTPDLACISLRVPEGAKYIGVLAGGDKQDDFVYFEPGTSSDAESRYRAHVCFDARSSENVGTIAVVASSVER